MDEKLGYPPAAVHWNLKDRFFHLADYVFRASVVANGLRVLLDDELADTDERLRPDSFPGHTIFWNENPDYGTLVARWANEDAVVMITEGHGAGGIHVAANDLELARKIIADVRRALPPIMEVRKRPRKYRPRAHSANALKVVCDPERPAPAPKNKDGVPPAGGR